MSNNEHPQRAHHAPFPNERRHTPKIRATAGTLEWLAELQAVRSLERPVARDAASAREYDDAVGEVAISDDSLAI